VKKMDGGPMGGKERRQGVQGQWSVWVKTARGGEGPDFGEREISERADWGLGGPRAKKRKKGGKR